jgi:hypothetical protein
MATRTKKSGDGVNSPKGIVGVRLDPRLRYLSEIAARARHCTLSSFIEFALDHALSAVTLYSDENDDVTVKDEAARLWDVDEVDRWVFLVFHYPSLMTFEEQKVWKLIKRNGFFWKGHYDWDEWQDDGDWVWEIKKTYLVMSRLREHWNSFFAVARGELDESELPAWVKIKAKPASWKPPKPSLDMDIPF